jgi:CheY-like chemotaxis protein
MLRVGLVVLLAEDNEVNQELAIAILERRGCHVVLARNGREAVALWERENYDVVLMDVQMPEMDGLIRDPRTIRQLEKARALHTPIVALTPMSWRATGSGAAQPAWTATSQGLERR